MTAHVTKRFAYFLADQVFESLSEAAPSRIYTLRWSHLDMHSKGKTCQHREALRQTPEKVGVVRPLRHLRRDLPKLLIFVEWLRTQHRDRESEHLRPGYCPFRLLRIHGALF